MTKADVAPLFEIPAGTLDDQDVDYLDGLLDSLAELSKGATGSGQDSSVSTMSTKVGTQTVPSRRRSCAGQGGGDGEQRLESSWRCIEASLSRAPAG